MKQSNQYRQGDVFVKQITQLPEHEEQQYQTVEGPAIDGEIILAHGEATGHKHAIKSYNAVLVKAKDAPKFFLVVNNPAPLAHEEHKPIELPVGNYKVVRQRQYTPQGIVNVAD